MRIRTFARHGIVLGFLFCLATALPVRVAHAQAQNQSYEDQLLRLSEILGALHHLRDICGADEGQLWREQMMALLEAEQPPGQFRARLIATFNNGYRGFQRTYGTCTTPAKTAADRFFTEGSQIAAALTIAIEAAAQVAADAAAADEAAASAAAAQDSTSTTAQ